MPGGLSQEYASTLRDYLDSGNEATLEHAYDIGRRAISAGLGVLDLANMYKEALVRILEDSRSAADALRVSEKSLVFFTESITPFEITHRGFQETNAKLQALTQELEKRVEQRTLELRQRERALELSNADLQQFANIISHDLQEPLRTIVSFLNLIKRRYQEKLDSNGREFIDFAIGGASRMQTMINGLLLYSRVETRGERFVRIDINNIIDQVIADLGKTIEDSGAKITHRSGLPVIFADPAQMAQLMQNLLSNAIKFRGPEPPRVRVDGVRDNSEWKFSVSDNGIGIDAKYSARIFVIFQRLHARAEYPGTGIGLAVCKRIIERHGGRIWFESKPGEGTTFYFTIPVDPISAPEPGRQEAAS